MNSTNQNRDTDIPITWLYKTKFISECIFIIQGTKNVKVFFYSMKEQNCKSFKDLFISVVLQIMRVCVYRDILQYHSGYILIL